MKEEKLKKLLKYIRDKTLQFLVSPQYYKTNDKLLSAIGKVLVVIFISIIIYSFKYNSVDNCHENLKGIVIKKELNAIFGTFISNKKIPEKEWIKRYPAIEKGKFYLLCGKEIFEIRPLEYYIEYYLLIFVILILLFLIFCIDKIISKKKGIKVTRKLVDILNEKGQSHVLNYENYKGIVIKKGKTYIFGTRKDAKKIPEEEWLKENPSLNEGEYYLQIKKEFIKIKSLEYYIIYYGNIVFSFQNISFKIHLISLSFYLKKEDKK